MKKSTLTPDQHRYAVESGIPIAPRKAGQMEYPFLPMEIGDSFTLRSDSYRECLAVNYFNKNHEPMKFVLRLDKSIGKYRCWRIA